MPHFRVDDALHGHPKAQRAGDDAIGMWVRAGSFCMAYLTDGFVPDWWVKQQPKGTAKARKLIAAGLWHGGAERDGEKGYQFHEFVGPGRQDSRAQIEADREKWRKKKAAQRAMSPGDTKGDRQRMSPGDTQGESPEESRVLPNTNPTKEISTHLRDDSHVSNAHDDIPLPPEPDDDYGPVPQHVDNPAKPAPRQPSQAAKTVVRQTLGTTGLAAYPRTFVDRLARQVENLTREGHPDTLIRQALTEWDKRADARPEWLPTVLGDLVKNQRATPGNNGKPTHKMRGLAELAQQVRAQEQANPELIPTSRRELT
ncbi:hypothetical protein [Mycolicibacterium conceptionense]|uniref:hypothetical protein n=1 Tax=Mycolicibacterium conceptionense TaxID=451644 RepID=UPI00096D82B5|nr:hypothetical protein [Mycolicibacterium conceptionense]OMB79260.1 hypothetical protein A5743_14235 [Mycolicibacterium conceptionense]